MVVFPPVIWNLKASQALRRYYEHIWKESPQNARNVQQGITKLVDQLPENPERYPLDKYKQNNPGNYRAFEKFSLRIAYRHSEKEIRILQVRHVKQQPKLY